MAREITKQAGKYFMTNVIAFVIAFPITFVLILAGFSIPMTGNIIIVPIAVCKFLLYKYWVFKNNLPRWIQQPSFYITIALTGYGVFLLIQYVCQDYYGLSEWTALGIASVIIGVIRFLFFRKLFAN